MFRKIVPNKGQGILQQDYQSETLKREFLKASLEAA